MKISNIYSCAQKPSQNVQLVLCPKDGHLYAKIHDELFKCHDIIIFFCDWALIQAVCYLWRLILSHKACAKVSELHHHELFLHQHWIDDGLSDLFVLLMVSQDSGASQLDWLWLPFDHAIDIIFCFIVLYLLQYFA